MHLSSKAPVARSAEPDWFEAQSRPLKELAEVRYKLQVDIIYAGDIFDRWNPNPELINFAIKFLPRGFAVPGNHDLPYHDYDQRNKSAYWTLVESEVIEDLEPGGYYQSGLNSNAVLHGFPHGYEVGKQPKFLDKTAKNVLHIAVVHQYIWQKGIDKHFGADSTAHVSRLLKRLKTWEYNCAVVGDNHHGFIHKNQGKTKDTYIMNCGAFIRRAISERDLKPTIGLIHSDGSITPYYLDTSEDKWIDPAEGMDDRNGDSAEVIEELMKMADAGVDFLESVKRYMDAKKISKPVREIILEAIQEL